MQNRLGIAIGFDASLEDEPQAARKTIGSSKLEPDRRQAAIGANADDRAGSAFAGGPEAGRPARYSTA
jgi:hypothetical protein